MKHRRPYNSKVIKIGSNQVKYLRASSHVTVEGKLCRRKMENVHCSAQNKIKCNGKCYNVLLKT